MVYLLLFSLFVLNAKALVISVDSPGGEKIKQIRTLETKLVIPTNVDYSEHKTTINVDHKYFIPKRPLSMDLRNESEPTNEKYKFCALSLCGAILVCGFVVGFVELVTYIPK